MANTSVEIHPKDLSASAVIGDNVVNRAGEYLGKIEELMLDPATERVTYAVVSFGGVMGIGEKLFVIPFEALKVDAGCEHFTLDVDQDKLKNAPSFDRNHPPQPSDCTWGAEVYRFYGHTPAHELAESLTQEGARNKALCRRFIQKVFNEGELSLMGDFVSPDVVNHEVADSFGDGGPLQGHNIDWMADLVYLYRHAFPDFCVEIQDQIAEGNRVVTCLRMRGTQKNELMTIAASGRKIDIAGIRVDRMAGGKIVESWSHFDGLGMLRQLDALPALKRRPLKVTPVFHEAAPGSKLPVAVWNAAPVPEPALISFI